MFNKNNFAVEISAKELATLCNLKLDEISDGTAFTHEFPDYEGFYQFITQMKHEYAIIEYINEKLVVTRK